MHIHYPFSFRFFSHIGHLQNMEYGVEFLVLYSRSLRLYTWTSPDGQQRNHIDYILCSKRWKSSIQSAKTRLGADCGSDHEFLIAKFRLKLKKVGTTTWRRQWQAAPVLLPRKSHGWRFVTLYRRQGSRPSPRKGNANRQNGCPRRPK